MTAEGKVIHALGWKIRHIESNPYPKEFVSYDEIVRSDGIETAGTASDEEVAAFNLAVRLQERVDEAEKEKRAIESQLRIEWQARMQKEVNEILTEAVNKKLNEADSLRSTLAEAGITHPEELPQYQKETLKYILGKEPHENMSEWVASLSRLTQKEQG